VLKNITSLFCIFLLSGCAILSNPSNADFNLLCSKWDDIVCEGSVDTEVVSGYLKILYFEDNYYYGTNVWICGRDLSLDTGNAFEDFLAGKSTDGEMQCADAEKENIEWEWTEGDEFSVYWGNIFLYLDVPECPYHDEIGGKRCAVEAPVGIDVL